MTYDFTEQEYILFDKMFSYSHKEKVNDTVRLVLNENAPEEIKDFYKKYFTKKE